MLDADHKLAAWCVASQGNKPPGPGSCVLLHRQLVNSIAGEAAVAATAVASFHH
jgi:hypothetical protein